MCGTLDAIHILPDRSHPEHQPRVDIGGCDPRQNGCGQNRRDCALDQRERGLQPCVSQGIEPGSYKIISG